MELGYLLVFVQLIVVELCLQLEQILLQRAPLLLESCQLLRRFGRLGVLTALADHGELPLRRLLSAGGRLLNIRCLRTLLSLHFTLDFIDACWYASITQLLLQHLYLLLEVPNHHFHFLR